MFARLIAQKLTLNESKVAAVLRLLDEGATIPFISRYRKEASGGMDEVCVENVSAEYSHLKEIDSRRATIIAQIEQQGKLTPDLQQQIEQTWDLTTLEDIYAPYKPKRKTRAAKAREQGLEPLALLMLSPTDKDPIAEAQKYLSDEVPTADDALQGARDIIAEFITDQPEVRQLARNAFRRQSVASMSVIKGKECLASNYADYNGRTESLKNCPSHRLLAMFRAENEGLMRLSVGIDNSEQLLERIKRTYVRANRWAKHVSAAIDDGYKRLLAPQMETEMRAEAKERADAEAISVFRTNLRQLLLDAPLGHRNVLALDPGFRTGCKVVCLNQQGDMLHHSVIYPHPPVSKVDESRQQIKSLVNRFHIEAVAIGNGTASRETEQFIRDLNTDGKLQVFVVSEDGASVYSASAVAREEFPNEDVTVRGAVSIGRRLIDPLSELVKIDPKSLGVGQYQHDVDQSNLKSALDNVVVSCVNQVGVDVNTASRYLLSYVSGLTKQTAQNIVDYRTANGPFASKSELKKVPRLGPKAYEQCAGFLRIPDAANPLDASAVHPESYKVVTQMARDLGCSVRELIADKTLRNRINIRNYVSDTIGLPTLTDIMSELEKPGRDPRQSLHAFAFDPTVHTINDLHVGQILPGIVTNITAFGAFVDIGVKNDGLVHISAVANHFVKDINSVLSLHQHVNVCVSDIDISRSRISLTMKGIEQPQNS